MVAASPYAPPAPTLLDERTPEQKYLDEIAPSSIAGKLIKFTKEGTFIINETGDEISGDDDFVALCDETLIGWIRFNEDGVPDRHQGLLYDGFLMPAREALGDADPAQWSVGLSGTPTDPWQHQVCLVLQSPTTQELFTFGTTSVTGRRAVHFSRSGASNVARAAGAAVRFQNVYMLRR